DPFADNHLTDGGTDRTARGADSVLLRPGGSVVCLRTTPASSGWCLFSRWFAKRGTGQDVSSDRFSLGGVMRQSRLLIRAATIATATMGLAVLGGLVGFVASATAHPTSIPTPHGT